MNRKEKQLGMVAYPFLFGMVTATLLFLMFSWDGWYGCPPWLTLIAAFVMPSTIVCTMIVITWKFHKMWNAKNGIFIIIKEDDQ